MLILYSGSDSYRLRHAAGDFIASRRAAGGKPLNVFDIDGSAEDAAERLEHPLKYTSFFDETKLIVVRDAASGTLNDVLKRYGRSATDDTILAIQDTTHECCDKKSLAALARAADRTTTFDPLKGAELTRWAHDYCRTRGASIEPEALKALLQRTASDAQAISNELEKLCAYVRTGTIDLRSVLELTPARYEYDEWELSNALAAHDKRAAIAVLWRRLRQGAPEQLLVASVAAAIRNLSMLKDTQTRRIPAATIAKTTGLHPYVISKTGKGAAAADAMKLRRAHIGLAMLDRDSKNGVMDTVDGLFSVLLSL